ncbi:glutathione S-transferase APIC-like [Durio zibethinus]|uniref:glutathione transferase n=1 Tax=Durio zibethinus TaxID=66656 RepID=A0A6P5X1S2_DURZI|nr:glutathione S-transferase APIC-like [Durio zibethinus]
MGIKVYGIAMSTCTARVLPCLCEKGHEYELVPLDLENSACKQQPYLSLNVRLRSKHLIASEIPFGQIPAFEDEDVKVFGKMEVIPVFIFAHSNQRLVRELKLFRVSLVVRGDLKGQANQDTNCSPRGRRVSISEDSLDSLMRWSNWALSP